jgi:hypothetical protein
MARRQAAEVLRINPKFPAVYWFKISPFLWKDQSELDYFIDVLRKAGLK